MDNKGNLYFVKAIVLGNYAVGKTTFMMTYIEQEPYYESKGTLVWDVQHRTMNNSNAQPSIYVEITDTAGQEKGNNIVNNSIMRSKALTFLMFDLTDKDTFVVPDSKSKGVEYWYNDYISMYGDSKHTMVLIGNKADLKEKR
jgi:GTPase SAR1 family protein